MSNSNEKHESGLSELARKALDAILNRDKDDKDEETTKDRNSNSSSIGRQEGKGGGSAADILSAGTQGAARSANRAEGSTEGGVSVGKRAGSSDSGSSSGVFDAASAGANAASAAVTGASRNSIDSSSTDVSMGSGDPIEEEPFVGSGGVGSAEFMEALRKGHEAAGGEYTSDLSDPNKQDDGPTGA